MRNDGNSLIIRGNLAEPPQLRFTPNGVAVCDLIVLVNPRDNRAGVVATRHRVVAWGQLAENSHETLTTGSPVIVLGEQITEQYADKTTGEDRYTTKTKAETIGPDLWKCTGRLTRTTRSKSAEILEAPAAGGGGEAAADWEQADGWTTKPA